MCWYTGMIWWRPQTCWENSKRGQAFKSPLNDAQLRAPEGLVLEDVLQDAVKCSLWPACIASCLLNAGLNLFAECRKPQRSFLSAWLRCLCSVSLPSVWQFNTLAQKVGIIVLFWQRLCCLHMIVKRFSIVIRKQGCGSAFLIKDRIHPRKQVARWELCSFATACVLAMQAVETSMFIRYLPNPFANLSSHLQLYCRLSKYIPCTFSCSQAFIQQV